jgi:hypothetical protein
VELNEAMQRIVRAHWYVIVLCVVAGIAIASAIQPGGSRYAASTRVALGTTTPQTEAEAAAIASTARAIVTGRERVRDALGAAQLNRNATRVAENDVTVSQLGTSNVVAVTVTDRDPQAAAALANALGSELEQTWLAIGHGQTSQTVTDLNARLAALSTQIGTLDAQINATVDPPVKGTDPIRTLLARRDDLSRQATALESERDRLVSSDAQDVQASIVDSASVPGEAQPTDNAIRIALGDKAREGERIAAGGARQLDAERRWFWKPDAVQPLPPAPASDLKDPQPPVPSHAIASGELPGGARTIGVGRDGDAVYFQIVGPSPATDGDGWQVADQLGNPAVAVMNLPGERPSYGGQDMRAPDERWQLKRGQTYWVRIGKLRKRGLDKPALVNARTAPIRVP